MSFKRYATGYCKLHDADRTIPITYAFIRKKHQIHQNTCVIATPALML